MLEPPAQTVREPPPIVQKSDKDRNGVSDLMYNGDQKDDDDGWRKVRAPRAWKPAEGEILEGVYLGPKAVEGQHGPYTKYIVAEDRTSDPFFVTGTVMDTLITTSLVQPGAKVRILFKGLVETGNGMYYKDFDMFVKRDVL